MLQANFKTWFLGTALLTSPAVLIYAVGFSRISGYSQRERPGVSDCIVLSNGMGACGELSEFRTFSGEDGQRVDVPIGFGKSMSVYDKGWGNVYVLGPHDEEIRELTFHCAGKDIPVWKPLLFQEECASLGERLALLRDEVCAALP